MLTEDENIIEVPLTVQYKISDLQSFVLNVDQPEISLQHATDSAVAPCRSVAAAARWHRGADPRAARRMASRLDLFQR
ncbi:hypothetical protein SSTU70S_04767 [Stutzerimonas stutzeri]